jgi:hypothetical protein
MKILKGKSTNKQMEHIDKILSRLLAKPSFKLAATPMPIGGYVHQGNGVLFGFVAPWEGKVLGGAIFVEQFTPENKELMVEFFLDVKERTVGQRIITLVKSGLVMIEKEMSLVRGDRLIASVQCDEPDQLFGSYLSILFIPEIRNFQKIWSPEGIIKETEE